ncbi:MAG: SMC-Scp complex subunit ScpB [Rhodospirillales bacterium]
MSEQASEEVIHEEADAEAPAEEAAPDPEEIAKVKRVLEAILFATAEPVSERALANRVPEGMNTKTILKDLQDDYEARGVNLVRAGASWAFRTAEDLGPVLNVEAEVERKLSRAAMETLAIIAYHQPVSRPEIEEIRGVGLSKGTLDLLFEKSWIKPKGRREAPGRPMTWGTTDVFLDHFGLEKIGDLPGLDDLKAAGLLESGPALNVYRSRGGDTEADKAAQPPKPADDGVLSEPDDEEDIAEPLDPNAA